MKKVKNMNSKRKGITALAIIAVVLGTGTIGYFIINQALEVQGISTREFVDSHERTITVPKHALRIVSVSPSVTEILYALGEQDRLVGVTAYCNYPAEAANKTQIGGFSTPDLEILASLDPDLIISATWNEESVNTLTAAGYTVAILEADTLLDIINMIRDFGDLVDSEQNATRIADEMTTKMWEITNSTAAIETIDQLECYFEIWESPMVVGGDSFLNDMMEKAGAINIFADIPEEYPSVSNENIISGNPDVIFTTEHSAAWYAQELSNRTGYNGIDAVINERVYSLNDDIFLRMGPRIIEALEIMTNYLYPDLL